MAKKVSWKLRLILSVLVSAALVFACYWYLFARFVESTDNAYLKTNMTMISPKVGGYIESVHIDDNQLVQEGEVLAVIDARDYEAKVAQAEAALATIQAKIATLTSQRESQLAAIKDAEAGIRSAGAMAERARKEYQRTKSLAEIGATSTQSLEVVTADNKSSRAMVDKARANKEAAESQLKTIEAQMAEVQAEVKTAQATLALVKLDLDNTRIKAPVTGRIGNKTVQVGQLVRPGTALGFLIPDGDIWVEANFKEVQIGKMRPGLEVDIHVDALPKTKFSGVVDSLSPASGSEFSILPEENATGNFTKVVRRIPVKIRFNPHPDLEKLKPGMSTVVKVRLDY